MGYRILAFLVAVVIELLMVRRDRRWAWPLAVVWLAALVYAAFLSRRPYAAPRALFDSFHALKLFLKADNVALLKRLRYLGGAGLNILLSGICCPRCGSGRTAGGRLCSAALCSRF